MFFKKYWFTLCFVLLAALRMVNLDQDPPNRIISWITPEDEFYYNLGAMNLYQHGSVHNVLATEENIYYPITGVFTTPFVYSGMKLFGDNYWGFRLPLLLFSILSCLLFLRVLNMLFPQGTTLNRLVTLFLLAEFSFAMYSRYLTPVGWATCWSIVVLYTLVMAWQSNKNVWYFLCGVSIVVLVLWIYVYTLFVGAALACIMLYLLITKQVTFTKMLYIVAGAITAVLLYSLVSYVVGGFSLSDTIHNLLFLKSHEVTMQKEKLSLFTLVYNKLYDLVFNYIPQLFTINIFRFNLVLLPLVALIFVFKKLDTQSNKNIYLFVLLVVVFAFGQFFFIKTSPASRKLTMVLPFILILVRAIDWEAAGKMDIKKILGLVAFVLLPGLVIYFSMSPDFASADLQSNSINVPWMLMAFNLAAVVAVIIILLRGKPAYIPIVIFTLLILPSVTYGVYYHSFKSTFRNKTNMIAIGKVLGKEMLAGDFSQGYQLYNDITAVVNPYYYKSNGRRMTIDSKIDSLFSAGAARYTMLYVPFKTKCNNFRGEVISFYNHQLVVDTIFTFSQSKGVLFRKL